MGYHFNVYIRSLNKHCLIYKLNLFLKSFENNSKQKFIWVLIILMGELKMGKYHNLRSKNVNFEKCGMHGCCRQRLQTVLAIKSIRFLCLCWKFSYQMLDEELCYWLTWYKMIGANFTWFRPISYIKWSCCYMAKNQY